MDFWKSCISNASYIRVRSKSMMVAGAEWYLCMGGKTGGAIWVYLHFLVPPFASRQKVENKHSVTDSESKETTALGC
jgi:hypothetical protein